MNAPPRRPWWRKKRWIAVAVVWMLAWWPLSVGPYVYLRERGWLARQVALTFCWDPIPVLFGVTNPYRHEEAPLLFRCWHEYGSYCREAGIRHREAEQQVEVE